MAVGSLTGLTACGSAQEIPVQNQNLTSSVARQEISVTDVKPDFHDAQMQFAVKLFQETVSRNQAENTLVSPLSVMLALSMTANGADNQTKSQMEAVLGDSIENLNQNLYSYVQKLPSSNKAKLSIANSIWVKDDGMTEIKPDFLQADADYYQADVYQEDFSQQTCDNINAWVRKHTDNMIDSIIDGINPDAFMYLINALAFDAKWREPYEESKVHDGRTFTNAEGIQKEVTMMTSSENSYLKSEQAVGFIKPYVEGYSFAALLPNENLNIDDYISSLDASGLSEILNNAQDTEVIASMPRFKSEFGTLLNDILQSMGMTDAFIQETADFSRMSNQTGAYIGNVIHKTYIEVDEHGTKAAAVTAVEMDNEAIVEIFEPKLVTLDRPFVYMIIDNETQLPVFIGTVKDTGTVS